MTVESCPHCGFSLHKRRPDGRCVSCGKQILPATATPALPTIVALKQADDAKATAIEKDLRAFLVQKLAEGFDDEVQIMDQASALFVRGEGGTPSSLAFRTGTEYAEEEVRLLAERIIPELLDRYRRLERQWDEATDCDRLDRAFDELNRQGILAQQNLPCCNTCARVEIVNQMEAEISSGATVVGYAFYHAQDTELAPHGELFLSYGSHPESPEQTLRVGRETVQAFERAGLKAAWSNKPDDRIAVTLVWRKRRFSRCP